MLAQTPHEEAIVSEIQQLMDRMPVARIARQAGVEQDDARRALEAVLPALVGGMQANAQDPAGAASLERALTRHEGLLSARAAEDGDADVDEGQRIVRNVFGGETDQVVSALGGAGGGGLGDVVRKVLPIVAPIVMAWLAERLFSGGGATGDGSTRTDASTPSSGQRVPTSGDNPFANSGGGAGGGSLRVPSGRSGSQQQSGGGGLGDLLGGILGGGAGGHRSSGGGILGDLLGGLLGGGRR